MPHKAGFYLQRNVKRSGYCVRQWEKPCVFSFQQKWRHTYTASAVQVRGKTLFKVFRKFVLAGIQSKTHSFEHGVW